ncbi:THO complex subunit 1 transcription elongation factor-domain-containing protein, partial [Ochromonadaceae sp. CCMP2298]
MAYLGKIEQLKAAVSAAFRQEGTERLDQFKADAEKILGESADVGGDLEIGFRGVMQALLSPEAVVAKEAVKGAAKKKAVKSKDVKAEKEGEKEEDVVRLLQFSFDFIILHHKLSPLLAKIPYLMLEDVLENQTIERAASTWRVVESLVGRITHADLFPKGKLTILKACNSLLRKLSKSCNTEFCGRVLMFLAAIYPLSEKSALNLPGK